MSNSVHYPESLSGNRRPAANRPGSRFAIHGGLFFLFAVELFLLGVVVWTYFVNRSIFPNSHGQTPDIWWGFLAIAAAGWGSWYLIQSRNAFLQWNISHSRNLLAIAVASGAVLIGILLVQIATALISSPVYIDARPTRSIASDSSESVGAAALTGDAANGKKWFSMSCVSCHGPDGGGVTNAAPSLRASEFLKSSDAQAIASLIRNGRAANDPANKTGKVMPAKGGNPFLDETKIADLVALLQDLEGQFGTSFKSESDMISGADLKAVKSQIGNDPATTVRKWTLEDLSGLQISINENSLKLGMQAFVKANCNQCHMATVAGQELGPTLDQVVAKYPPDQLLKHVVEPSLEINEKYLAHTFLLIDGEVLSGVISRETEEEIEIITDLLKPHLVEMILVDDIDDRVVSKLSPMPSGLVDVLTEQEIEGLVAYIEATGNQLIASNALPINRWVVPAVETNAVATTWTETSSGPVRSSAQRYLARNNSRYTNRLLWLFGVATSVLSLHFLWVIGAGSAVVLNDLFQLDLATQMRLSGQVFLFWCIGLAWLVLWFLIFFLIG